MGTAFTEFTPRNTPTLAAFFRDALGVADPSTLHAALNHPASADVPDSCDDHNLRRIFTRYP